MVAPSSVEYGGGGGGGGGRRSQRVTKLLYKVLAELVTRSTWAAWSTKWPDEKSVSKSFQFKMTTGALAPVATRGTARRGASRTMLWVWAKRAVMRFTLKPVTRARGREKGWGT